MRKRVGDKWGPLTSATDALPMHECASASLPRYAVLGVITDASPDPPAALLAAGQRRRRAASDSGLQNALTQRLGALCSNDLVHALIPDEMHVFCGVWIWALGLATQHLSDGAKLRLNQRLHKMKPTFTGYNMCMPATSSYFGDNKSGLAGNLMWKEHRAVMQVSDGLGSYLLRVHCQYYISPPATILIHLLLLQCGDVALTIVGNSIPW